MNDNIKESFRRIKEDMYYLQQEIALIKEQISQISSFLSSFSESNTSQTEVQQTEETPTDIKPILNELSFNSQSSIGNRGVPTDKQTNRQTHDIQPTDTLKRTSNILIELKDIQRKFKNLTNQEFLIFSAMYLLTEKQKQTSYKEIADKTNLSESSVRDYIGKLVRKGVPIEKLKLNNKQILLNIPREFKEVATLDILTKVRE